MDLMNFTIGQYLKKTADLYPNHEAVLEYGTNRKWTWKELDTLSSKYAKGLLALGLNKGDHLVLWGTNKAEWVVSFFAAAKIGLITIPMNINYHEEEALKLLKNSDAKALIFMDGFRNVSYIEIVRKLIDSFKNNKVISYKLPKLEYLIHFGEEKFEQGLEFKVLTKLGETITDETLDDYMNHLDLHDTVNIQFTSGTTSTQKGVMLTHYNLVNNSLISGKYLGLTQEDRLCIPVPFFHCFGLSAGILQCVGSAATMVLVECYRPVEVMKAVSSLKCTALHGVPTMFQRILERVDFKEYDFSSLSKGIVAGASCNEKTIRAIVDKLGMEEVQIGYGQTECSPSCTQSSKEDSLALKIHTVGKVLPFAELKIIHPLTKEECKVNEKGEICTRGYHVMKGYYKNPKQTREVIDSEGWLHTGDIGALDEKGYCHLYGRLKEIIIRGGENISPLEIEEVILRHPFILDVQVYSVPSEYYGDEIASSICLKPKATLSIEDIKNFLKGKLASYKVPRYIEFIDKMPVSQNGKVLKRVLQDNMVKKIKEAQYNA